jgi:hypothetical protein
MHTHTSCIKSIKVLQTRELDPFRLPIVNNFLNDVAMVLRAKMAQVYPC